MYQVLISLLAQQGSGGSGSALAQREGNSEYRQYTSHTQVMRMDKNVNLRFCIGDKLKKQAVASCSSPY